MAFEDDLLWDYVEIDSHGTSTIVLRKEILNFPKLMNSVIKQKIGMDRGYFKICFDTPLECGTTLEVLKNYVEKYFNTKRYVNPQNTNEKGKLKFPTITEQNFFYGDHEHHVYGCRSFELDENEQSYLRSLYLHKIKDTKSFFTETDCSRKLAESVDVLLEHYWSVIRSVSVKSSALPEENYKPVDELHQKAIVIRDKFVFDGSMVQPMNDFLLCKGSKDIVNIHRDESRFDETTIIYADDIPVVDTQFNITRNFSLSSLGTVLDLCHTKNISSPKLYGGLEYATFPWHTEHNGLFSANYLHCGAPCLWLMVSPDFFKKISDVKKFHLDAGQVSCDNIIGGGHKYVVASEEFLSHFGIPVHKVIQRNKELLVVYPFTAHSGFKVGTNFQESVNFADEFWVEPAIFSPSCVCFENIVHLDLSEFIAVCRPNLLHMYLKRDLLGLIRACSQNDFLSRVGIIPTLSVLSVKKTMFKQKTSYETQKCSVNGTESQFKGANCTLICPSNGCNKKFEGGRSKLFRLEKHIRLHHPEDPKLLKETHHKYPPKHRKSKALLCPHCGQWKSGGVTQMRLHVSRKHPNYV